tara:strand:- start:14122 stop:14553 length:432 start_codon:yes stop_codon:yes gene_type:complete
MDTIQKAVLIGHTLIALLIIALVLLQRGKGADAGAAFGAGASGTVFGARGSGSFFSRATAICATAFFVTSLTLAYLSSQSTSAPTSVLDDAALIEESVEADDGLPAIDDAENALDNADNSSELPSLDEAVENIDDAVEEATSE